MAIISVNFLYGTFQLHEKIEYERVRKFVKSMINKIVHTTHIITYAFSTSNIDLHAGKIWEFAMFKLKRILCLNLWLVHLAMAFYWYSVKKKCYWIPSNLPKEAPEKFCKKVHWKFPYERKSSSSRWATKTCKPLGVVQSRENFLVRTENFFKVFNPDIFKKN